MYSIEVLDFCNAGNNQIITCHSPDNSYRGCLFCGNKKIEIIGSSIYSDFGDKACYLLKGNVLTKEDIGKTFIEK